MDRRLFMSQLGLAMTSCAIPLHRDQPRDFLPSQILSSKTPVALAMWDYSWLLRRYPGGGFEDWDRALDDLISRGYNAIRIDCFPQFIGADDLGAIHSEIHLPVKGKRRALWGNEYSVDITPLESLITFLHKCAERKVAIVLASWFLGHGTSIHQEFSGAEGLIRAWDQTLSLIQSHDLLQDVLYVDLLNEYPLWHGYQWLHDQLNAISPIDDTHFDFLNKSKTKRYTDDQILYYNCFLNTVLRSLKTKWPSTRFMASQTNTLNTPWSDQDTSLFDVLDIHLWMVYHQSFSEHSSYFSAIHSGRDKRLQLDAYKKMLDYWRRNKTDMTKWLSQGVADRKSLADDLDVPVGCTEGWGSVMWPYDQHLDWTFIKESGLAGAELGAKHGYAFNCSSNFTHPHFTSLWNDIDWHREVTRIIRKL